jgi:ABC-type transporter Mla subunit MlaD
MNATDHALLAGAMALAMGLVKVLEKVFDWASNRKGKEIKAVLDGDTARTLRETNEQVRHTSDIIGLRDNDGIPMVYTPRSYLDNQLKMTEALRDLSQNQDTTTSQLEATNKKIDEILASIKK